MKRVIIYTIFILAVQNANTSGKPILLQVDYNADHGDSGDKFAAYKKRSGEIGFNTESQEYEK